MNIDNNKFILIFFYIDIQRGEGEILLMLSEPVNTYIIMMQHSVIIRISLPKSGSLNVAIKVTLLVT